MFVRNRELRIERQLNRAWHSANFRSPSRKARWLLQREQNDAVQNALRYVDVNLDLQMKNVKDYRTLVQYHRKRHSLPPYLPFMLAELQNSVHYWKLVKWHIQRLRGEWQPCPTCNGSGIASVAEQDATLEVTFCPACNGYGKTSPNYVVTLDGVRVMGERDE